MSDADFIARFGGIYEHSSWVAERAGQHLDSSGEPGDIAVVMADCVDNASPDLQLALIRAHPDLAGKAQIGGELTASSATEQASAGLDQCTPDEFRQFQTLNAVSDPEQSLQGKVRLSLRHGSAQQQPA